MENLLPGQFRQIQFGIGNEMYVTPCIDCGEPVKTWVRRKDVVFKCAVCRAKDKEKASELKNRLSDLKKLRRFESMKEILIRQNGNLNDYESAIERIREKLNKQFWFQSVNEMLVAAELLRCKVKARHQVKMGKWRVDFIIDSYKVILEIDGFTHSIKNVKERDKLKDTLIIANKGPEWEVIRIKENMIKGNLRYLMPFIKKIVSERERLRRNYNGNLPTFYNDDNFLVL